MRDLVINSTVQHTLLIIVPFLFAYVLRKSKLRGWSMVGGVLGGIILGPAVLGAVAPDYWEGIFQGGEYEHAQVLQLARLQQADVLAARTVGASEIEVVQLHTDHQILYAQQIEQWEHAKWKDQRPLRDFAMAIMFFALISGHIRCKENGKASPLLSLSVGVWASIIPGGILSLIAYKVWSMELPAALALGACLGVGPWTFTRWEQRIANQSQVGGANVMLNCGRVAWVVASTAGIYATWQLHGFMSLVWMLPLLLFPIVWLFPPREMKQLNLFVDYVAIPTIMATALVLINPFESFLFWPSLIVILLCADARWLGGIFGLGILGGRNSANAMRMTIPLVDAGVSQLCMATLLLLSGVLPAAYAIAILIGAVYLEVTAPMRFKFATRQASPKNVT